MSASTQDLVDLLDIEELDTGLYRGRQPTTSRQRVFGGQVAAQALIAVTRSVDPAYVVHSLHSYFLLPGDVAVPIVYDVEPLRDGRSFATRRVAARQHGRPIFYLTANFQRAEPGLEHQDAMPTVPPPEECPALPAVMASLGRDEAIREWDEEWGALEVHYVGNTRHGLEPDPDHPAQARLWCRVSPTLPDDPVQHAAAFTYASDFSLVSAALVPHDLHVSSPGMQVASLDHTIWFHRPFRADEWWLYDQVSPVATGGRGLALARIFTPAGVLVATVAQEGLIRRRAA